MRTSGGATQHRIRCPCSEPLAGSDLAMHSQVSSRNLSYFISERRVPSDVDEDQLRRWYEQGQATDRTLVACNNCRRVVLYGDGEREVLTGPDPRGGGS